MPTRPSTRPAAGRRRDVTWHATRGSNRFRPRSANSTRRPSTRRMDARPRRGAGDARRPHLGDRPEAARPGPPARRTVDDRGVAAAGPSGRGASASSSPSRIAPMAATSTSTASIEALAEARARGEAPDPERLHVRGWARPGTALCLIVDRSGSMGGRPLATSAVAAAAIAWRAPDDYSVLAFGQGRGGGQEPGRPQGAGAGRQRRARPTRDSARPTWPAHCGPQRCSWPAAAPGAGSPSCSPTVGRPCRATSPRPRGRSTSCASSPRSATPTRPAPWPIRWGRDWSPSRARPRSPRPSPPPSMPDAGALHAGRVVGG